MSIKTVVGRVGFADRGPWDRGRAEPYQPMDLVTHNGAVWSCLIANKAQEPNENSIYWHKWIEGVIPGVNVRRKLTEETTFFLRLNGNDANDGRTEATAMKTFNNLMERLYNEYDPCGKDININIGEGTWTDQMWKIDSDKLSNWVTLTIQGAGQDKTILSANGPVGLGIYGPRQRARLRIQDVQFVNCGTSIDLAYGATLRGKNLTFGPHLAGNSRSDVNVSFGSRFTAWADAGELARLVHTSGDKGFQYCYRAVHQSSWIDLTLADVVISPVMTASGFAYLEGNAYMGISASTRFTGELNGSRLTLKGGSMVDTGGCGESVFPGTEPSYLVPGHNCFID